MQPNSSANFHRPVCPQASPRRFWWACISRPLQALEGKESINGKLVWRTARAKEYPSAMNRMLAQSLADFAHEYVDDGEYDLDPLLKESVFAPLVATEFGDHFGPDYRR